MLANSVHTSDRMDLSLDVTFVVDQNLVERLGQKYKDLVHSIVQQVRDNNN